MPSKWVSRFSCTFQQLFLYFSTLTVISNKIRAYVCRITPRFFQTFDPLSNPRICEAFNQQVMIFQSNWNLHCSRMNWYFIYHQKLMSSQKMLIVVACSGRLGINLQMFRLWLSEVGCNEDVQIFDIKDKGLPFSVANASKFFEFFKFEVIKKCSKLATLLSFLDKRFVLCF